MTAKNSPNLSSSSRVLAQSMQSNRVRKLVAVRSMSKQTPSQIELASGHSRITWTSDSSGWLQTEQAMEKFGKRIEMFRAEWRIPLHARHPNSLILGGMEQPQMAFQSSLQLKEEPPPFKFWSGRDGLEEEWSRQPSILPNVKRYAVPNEPTRATDDSFPLPKIDRQIVGTGSLPPENFLLFTPLFDLTKYTSATGSVVLAMELGFQFPNFRTNMAEGFIIPFAEFGRASVYMDQ
ncbi:hypothetical protein Cgig2_012115 [Carnegiea gigantea]|uniref:Uncharacterized protein n=1 Tax=Carnegiea gigantea TaxID=171969 RepID=A0A9Q1QP02_9CARY|nr:hypothetical protein Cgig2_012115 [Carnegiea gigantea]